MTASAVPGLHQSTPHPLAHWARLILLAALAGIVSCQAQTAAAPVRHLAGRGALASGDLAITNVSVVTMTGNAVMRDAAVLARDGRITYVGPLRDLRLPQGARVVD